MKTFFIYLLILSETFVFGVSRLSGQSQANMYLSGDMNSWQASAMHYRPLGTPSWSITVQATADNSASGFKFRNSTDSWDHLWGASSDPVGTQGVSINTEYTAYSGGGNGSFNQSSGNYYTFIWKDVANGNDSKGYVMETSAQPVTIDAVSQQPGKNDVSENDAVVVTITTSSAPCAEEHIYLRYFVNGWQNQHVVAFSFSGTTGTATIPKQTNKASVNYYVFSTTVSGLTSGSAVNFDLLTINYNNNGGPNYTYTVKRQGSMYWSGDMNSWGARLMAYRPLGTPSWITTIHASGAVSSSGFKFRDSDANWVHSWGRGDNVNFDENTTWYSGGDNGTFSQSDGKYYTFTWEDVSDASDSHGYVMETGAQPVTIDVVSQQPVAEDVSDNDAVTVTVTTSAAPCTEEKVYVRYSTDGWHNSAIIPVSFTGSAGTASIPVQNAETAVSYYVFSTTVSNPASDYDLLTINYNNNGGPNYSYTVKYGTTQSGNWSDAATWKAGAVPGNDKDVIIRHSVTVTNTISAPAECNDLTINAGASLAIDVGDGLTVNGDLTNSASASGLVVHSDATGNGSLIVGGTFSGNVTVKRYIKKFTTDDVTASGNGWHEIGCPVTSMPIANTDWDPTATGTKNDLYYWSEAENKWKNYRTTVFDFTDDKGYLVANDADLTHNFIGTLNTSDISISNLSYTAGEGNGWHLLGNPFSSALKWGTTNWNLNNVDGVAKVWNESGGNYNDVTVDGDNKVIPSTNGFFIQVTSGTNSLTIPAADRVHDATNNHKSVTATSPKETLTFKVSNDANGYYDISTLGFKAHATEGFDMAFDSHKLFSIVKTAPSLWTKSDAQDFSTNYLPETTTAYDVPLHFKPGVSTVYHLTIKGADSFDNTGLVLEDLKTGEKIDLSNTGSYDFSANKGDDVNRFVLHINGVTAVPNVNETDGIQVFSYGNTVYLHGQHMLNGKVSIFNTLGQKVYDGLLNGAAKQQIRVNRKGIYFVRVEETGHVFIHKVFIR